MKSNTSTEKFLRPYEQRFLCPNGQMERATVVASLHDDETCSNHSSEMSVLLLYEQREHHVNSSIHQTGPRTKQAVEKRRTA
jgi:hypothetical protein